MSEPRCDSLFTGGGNFRCCLPLGHDGRHENRDNLMFQWSDRQGTQPSDAICREIQRVQALYDRSLNVESDGAYTARLQWGGEIIGLRKALCVLLGWPLEEAAHEGKAHQYAAEWREPTA